MSPCDSRKILPCLVHSSQNYIILNREQFQVSDMLQCHWSCNFGKLQFFVSTITKALNFAFLITLTIKLFIYANDEAP